ncbi:RNA polymerase sigma factor [Pseudenhygromyxa sp. WMMC2535]|uniref:RNA polymerase sigma factor n=1 Tax=Pseudenhygromyxa sp. WMMC2535 TaxID=2712867 RepID=UPI00155777A7|nr:RNA polymerase sigma factor [Pseudenhygromyxa sp. WMMC2535]NVB40775.1 RNA polymerase sigma factor [Pseudenhygromyxa sp. WMMC2535]
MALLSPRDPLARLVARAVDGEREAFTRLYRELHPLIARFVARRVDSRADAEELVAEVFRRIVEHLGRFDAGKGSVRVWALRIARNAVIDHYRSRRRAQFLDTVADGLCERSPALVSVEGEPLAQLLDAEALAQVRGLVAQCPLETRKLLALRYGDGLRHREIAELMGLSEATVRKRLSRALRSLRTQMQAEAHDEPEVSHAH